MVSIAFGAPVPVGHIVEEYSLVAAPSPSGGGWISLVGERQAELARVTEGGGVRRVVLPPQLREGRLRVYPLADGWTVVIGAIGREAAANGTAANPNSLRRSRKRVAGFSWRRNTTRRAAWGWCNVSRTPRDRGEKAKSVKRRRRWKAGGSRWPGSRIRRIVCPRSAVALARPAAAWGV